MIEIPEQCDLIASGLKIIWSEKINDCNFPANQCAKKKSHMVIAMCVEPGSVFGNKVYDYAMEIAPKLFAKKACNGAMRGLDEVVRDNFAGILAELAVKEAIEFRYGKEATAETEHDTAKNQIDIKLINGATIEVRASSMRNGLKFALFHKNKRNNEFYDGDILGPYVTSYKSGETLKDYYIRVIFPCALDDVINCWNRNESILFYIVGGATMDMMQDEELYQTKAMNGYKDPSVAPGQYRVIPIAKGLDARQLFAELDNIDELSIKHSFFDNTPDKYIDVDAYDDVPMASNRTFMDIAATSVTPGKMTFMSLAGAKGLTLFS